MRSKKDSALKENSNVLSKGDGKGKIKFIIIILIGIILFVLLFLFLSKNNLKNEEKTFTLQEDDSLSIGVGKYLEFLWMVDGAFNDSRYNEKIKVNNEVLNNKNITFVCNYSSDKEKCKAENFEKSFADLFASNITYNDVYGDGLTFNWYEKRKDGYYFKNMNSCNIERMSTNQTLELVDETKDKLTYKVDYVDNVKGGTYNGVHKITRDFVLIKEKDSWKVSKAYYHDPCYMDYYIE